MDEELVALFREEVMRREVALRAAHTDSNAALRSLHSLKGSASMMGAKSLAKQIASLEVWVKTVGVTQPDALWNHLQLLLDQERISTPPLEPSSERTSNRPTQVAASTSNVLYSSVRASRVSSEPGAIAAAEPSAGSVYPKSAIDFEIREFFASESRARMQHFADALARARVQGGSLDALRESFTHIHAVKGGALTVGFMVMAQGAHAIEAILLGMLEQQQLLSDNVYNNLGHAAELLSVELAVLEESERLAQQITETIRTVGSPLTARAPSLSGPDKHSGPESSKVDAVRISSEDLLEVEERLADLLLLSERWSSASASDAAVQQRLLTLIEKVDDATRRLGPPRPWGVTQDTLDRFARISHELRDCATVIDAESYANARTSDQLATMAASSHDSMQRLSLVTFQWVCERLLPVIDATALATAKEVRVEQSGSTVTLPRRIAERLVEPLSQIVRNAVTHGIEAPKARIACDKRSNGTLKLTATSTNSILCLTVEDDGAGIDLQTVSTRGRALGLSPSPGGRPYELLFFPGFSMLDRADTLAGRGVGLDLVRREVLALGGSVSVQSSKGERTSFTVEIPVRSALLRVLIVSDGGVRVAIPIEHVLRVRTIESHETPAALSDWLSPGLPAPALRSGAQRMGVELAIDSTATLLIEVHGIEQPREVLVRPMPTLLAGWQHWLGAIIDTDNAVILVAAVTMFTQP